MIEPNTLAKVQQWNMVVAERNLMSRILDQVHIKLGHSAFEELVRADIRSIDEFFWKYMKWELDSKITYKENFQIWLARLFAMDDHSDMLSFGGSSASSLPSLKDGEVVAPAPIVDTAGVPVVEEPGIAVARSGPANIVPTDKEI